MPYIAKTVLCLKCRQNQNILYCKTVNYLIVPEADVLHSIVIRFLATRRLLVKRLLFFNTLTILLMLLFFSSTVTLLLMLLIFPVQLLY